MLLEQYERDSTWKRELPSIRRLLASKVWQDMLVNELNSEEAAENFDLPLDAIHEIIHYCEANKELIKMEAQEELYRLKERGASIES